MTRLSLPPDKYYLTDLFCTIASLQPTLIHWTNRFMLYHTNKYFLLIIIEKFCWTGCGSTYTLFKIWWIIHLFYSSLQVKFLFVIRIEYVTRSLKGEIFARRVWSSSYWNELKIILVSDSNFIKDKKVRGEIEVGWRIIKKK